VRATILAGGGRQGRAGHGTMPDGTGGEGLDHLSAVVKEINSILVEVSGLNITKFVMKKTVFVIYSFYFR
jgi:hypothetical protein